MGKRFIFAIILSMLVILVWSHLFPGPKPPIAPTEEPSWPVEELARPEAKPTKIVGLPEGASDVLVETDLFRAVFTTSGGRIKSLRLKRYDETEIKLKEVEGLLENKRRSLGRQRDSSARQRTEFEIADLEYLLDHLKARSEQIGRLQMAVEEAEGRGAAAEAEALAGQLACEQGLEMVSVGAARLADYPLSVELPREERSRALNLAIYKPDKEKLILDREEGTITFVSPSVDGLTLTKRYTFWPDSYAVGLGVTVRDKTPRLPSEGSLLLWGGREIGLPELTDLKRYGYRGPVTLLRGRPTDIMVKEKYRRDETGKNVLREHKGQVLWTGLENKYFVVALIPEVEADVAVVEKDEVGAQRVGLKVPLRGEGPYRFRLYFGPKEEKRLKTLGVGLDRVVEYGFFGPIARVIAAVLSVFYGWTHNYGWAIVLLSLSIKVAFWPLTHRSFEAMQKMQGDMKGLQPELDDLKKKHGDNPRKLQKEQMELYKRKGVNPMAGCKGGCFPMLLQLPVFFALYVVLYSSIELRGADFLWWIKDLSSKDPYYVLPILMGVSMLVQQRLTGTGGGAQQQQAQLMMWMMPILFTWIFARLPSGVVLYWFAFNMLTSFQQILIKRKPRG